VDPLLKTKRRRHSSPRQQLSRRRSSHQDAMEGREEIDSMHPKRVQSVHQLTLTAALMASRSAPQNMASAGAEVARLRLYWKEARPFPLSLPSDRRGGKSMEVAARKGGRSVSQVELFKAVLMLRSPCTSRDEKLGRAHQNGSPLNVVRAS
jgi:hypothetical protein